MQIYYWKLLMSYLTSLHTISCDLHSFGKLSCISLVFRVNSVCIVSFRFTKSHSHLSNLSRLWQSKPSAVNFLPQILWQQTFWKHNGLTSLGFKPCTSRFTVFVFFSPIFIYTTCGVMNQLAAPNLQRMLRYMICQIA